MGWERCCPHHLCFCFGPGNHFSAMCGDWNKFVCLWLLLHQWSTLGSLRWACIHICVCQYMFMYVSWQPADICPSCYASMRKSKDLPGYPFRLGLCFVYLFAWVQIGFCDNTSHTHVRVAQCVHHIFNRLSGIWQWSTYSPKYTQTLTHRNTKPNKACIS